MFYPLAGDEICTLVYSQRHGFLIAPALLDVVMQLVNTGSSELAQHFALTLGATETLA